MLGVCNRSLWEKKSGKLFKIKFMIEKMIPRMMTHLTKLCQGGGYWLGVRDYRRFILTYQQNIILSNKVNVKSPMIHAIKCYLPPQYFEIVENIYKIISSLGIRGVIPKVQKKKDDDYNSLCTKIDKSKIDFKNNDGSIDSKYDIRNSEFFMTNQVELSIGALQRIKHWYNPRKMEKIIEQINIADQDNHNKQFCKLDKEVDDQALYETNRVNKVAKEYYENTFMKQEELHQITLSDKYRDAEWFKYDIHIINMQRQTCINCHNLKISCLSKWHKTYLCTLTYRKINQKRTNKHDQFRSQDTNELYDDNTLDYNGQKITVSKGALQGSVISPFQFNINLKFTKDALQSQSTRAIQQGNLMIFAYDIPNICQNEIHTDRQIIGENRFDEIDIVKQVKYLGFQLSLSKQELVQSAASHNQKSMYPSAKDIQQNAQQKMFVTEEKQNIMLSIRRNHPKFEWPLVLLQNIKVYENQNYFKICMLDENVEELVKFIRNLVKKKVNLNQKD
ncbi:UNKNOWN [Stylonychia lemnae]|uniref:Uncharacterized protein n=1 Tax=Stylonychia lemnae TaxID=5949 RepID=A0A078ATK7_STYLE|nr:UNKNOWN [Stylonychia lemnae]|eukprot:CDW85765.1 UNKNOWN [Stylonychia lemnae]